MRLPERRIYARFRNKVSLTEWLDLMLEEIARRKAEEAEARTEAGRRRDDADEDDTAASPGERRQER